MMDISTMTDEQKSVMLAKMRGWRVGKLIQAKLDDGSQWMVYDLYEPANMALARKIFRWAYDYGNGDIWPRFALKILIGDGGWEWGLDNILELAIEEGIVEVDGEIDIGQVEADDLEWDDPGIVKGE